MAACQSQTDGPLSQAAILASDVVESSLNRHYIPCKQSLPMICHKIQGLLFTTLKLSPLTPFFKIGRTIFFALKNHKNIMIGMVEVYRYGQFSMYKTCIELYRDFLDILHKQNQSSQKITNDLTTFKSFKLLAQSTLRVHPSCLHVQTCGCTVDQHNRSRHEVYRTSKSSNLFKQSHYLLTTKWQQSLLSVAKYQYLLHV